MEMTKRVCLYCRVSTKDQTVQNQLIDLRDYCRARGWTIVAEHVDEGISGTKQDRPALKEALSLARRRRIDVLLVWRFDRFARSTSHLVNTLDELKSLGVDFVSRQEAIDTSTPQGKMVFSVMASIAEFERSLIVERVMSGLRRAKEQGKRLGRVPMQVDMGAVAQLRANGKSVRQIGRALGISKSLAAKLVSTKPLPFSSLTTVDPLAV